MAGSSESTTTQFSAIVRLCHDLAQARTLADMFQRVTEALVAGTGVGRASVLTFDDAGAMRFRAAHGLSDTYQHAVDGHSPWQRGELHATPILVDDVTTHPATADLVPVLTAEGIRAVAFLPLYGGGELLGKFMLYADAPTTWEGVDLTFAGAVADLLAAFLVRERAQERAQQSRRMESLGQLAGGIAHDFNSLLTSMLGYADLLRAETLRDTPGRKYADDLRATVEQAADITRQLLAFARPPAMPPEMVDVNALIEESLPALQAACGTRHDIGVDLGLTHASLMANPTQFRQMLTHLVSNARDAMPDGGHILIAVRASSRAGYVELAVIDSGKGMDEATRQRIFEPLFTRKLLGRGSGLGLATSYAIVTRLGGAITARSVPGVGSEIVVTLPLAGHPYGDATAAAATPGASLAHGPVVLLVDDQDYVLAPLIHSLEGSGYTVRTAAHGKAALALLEAGPVDVVVSDIIMPVMDGAALAFEIRRRWPLMPVLLMTGYVDARPLPDDVPVLLKPFRPRELMFEIEQQLVAARAAREAAQG